MRGVVLYGAPAAGKDTVAGALCDRDGRYRHYRRVKHGSGRTKGYRMVEAGELARLRELPGEVLWETRRYAATYLVVRSHVLAEACWGVPVVALGEPEAVAAVTRGAYEVSWTVVQLWCPRTTAVERVAWRATGDDHERMRVYDATPWLSEPDVCVDTSRTGPEQAATVIDEEVCRG